MSVLRPFLQPEATSRDEATWRWKRFAGSHMGPVGAVSQIGNDPKRDVVAAGILRVYCGRYSFQLKLQIIQNLKHISVMSINCNYLTSLGVCILKTLTQI